MTKQIEAEGGELVLRNKNGSVAIIPARHRQEVLDMLKSGCTNCLNDYISKLPKMKDVAKDGTLIDDPPKKLPTLPTYYQSDMASDNTNVILDDERLEKERLDKEAELRNAWRKPVGTNVPYTEKLVNNVKGVGNILVESVAPIVKAGGATASMIMAAPMAATSLATPTLAQLLGTVGLNTAGALGIDHIYGQMGGEPMGDAFDVKNPTGRFAANLITPGTLAGFNAAIPGGNPLPKLPKQLASKLKSTGNKLDEGVEFLKDAWKYRKSPYSITQKSKVKVNTYSATTESNVAALNLKKANTEPLSPRQQERVDKYLATRSDLAGAKNNTVIIKGDEHQGILYNLERNNFDYIQYKDNPGLFDELGLSQSDAIVIGNQGDNLKTLDFTTGKKLLTSEISEPRPDYPYVKDDELLYRDDNYVLNAKNELNRLLHNNIYVDGKPLTLDQRAAITNNINYLETLGASGKAKVFGSAKLVEKGIVNKIPKDYDMIGISDGLRTTDKYTGRNAKFGPTYDVKGADVDMNTLNDPRLVNELYSEMFPKDPEIPFAAMKEKVIANFENHDMLEKTLIDTFSSGKIKHIRLQDKLISDPDTNIETLRATIAKRNDIVFGSTPDIPKLNFSDIEINKRLLKEMDFLGNAEMVAKDPSRMEIVYNDFYLRNTSYGRGFEPVKGVTNESVATSMPDKNIGGTAYGRALYGTAGDSGHGNTYSYVNVKPKYIKTNPSEDPLRYVKEIASYRNDVLIVDKIGEINTVFNKYGISPLNPTDTKLLLSDILYALPDDIAGKKAAKEISQIMNKEIITPSRLNSKSGHSYGNADLVLGLDDISPSTIKIANKDMIANKGNFLSKRTDELAASENKQFSYKSNMRKDGEMAQSETKEYKAKAKEFYRDNNQNREIVDRALNRYNDKFYKRAGKISNFNNSVGNATRATSIIGGIGGGIKGMLAFNKSLSNMGHQNTIDIMYNDYRKDPKYKSLSDDKLRDIVTSLDEMMYLNIDVRRGARKGLSREEVINEYLDGIPVSYYEKLLDDLSIIDKLDGSPKDKPKRKLTSKRVRN